LAAQRVARIFDLEVELRDVLSDRGGDVGQDELEIRAQ
jgi:hypothetical protein